MEIGVSNWETLTSDHKQWIHLTACVESFESNRLLVLGSDRQKSLEEGWSSPADDVPAWTYNVFHTLLARWNKLVPYYMYKALHNSVA